MRETNRHGGRRRTSPRRALIGGALVAAAALGVFSAHRGATGSPTDRYMVAMRDIPAGTPIRQKDLGAMAIDLPDGVPAFDPDQIDLVEGRVTSGDLSRFELVSDSDFHAADHFTRPGATMLTLDMTPARAMSGVVSAGDQVSVTSTDPQGSGTTLLTAEALVVSTSGGSQDSIGAATTVRVVLSVDEPSEATAIIDASVNTELALLLVTPIDGGTR